LPENHGKRMHVGRKPVVQVLGNFGCHVSGGCVISRIRCQ
jgi:hypothetical protein